MRALVTGASGFLGGRLVDLLLAEGTDVLILARPSSLIAERPGQSVVRAELASAADDPTFGSAFTQVTHVFHCAGCSTDWAPRSTYVQANVDGVAAMLALAERRMPRLARFVHVSTTDVYGYPPVAGDESLAPRGIGLPYNETKLHGEQLVWAAAGQGLPVTVVRPASIYGPGGKAFVTDIVALLRQRLMLLVDGGHAPGGFVYVEDVCRAMLLAAQLPVAAGEVYNISSTDATTWRTYTHALAAKLGLATPWLQLPFGAAMALAAVSELPGKAGLPLRPLLTRHAVHLLGRDQQYGTDKARTQLGWQPQVSLAEGIAHSVAGLKGAGR